MNHAENLLLWREAFMAKGSHKPPGIIEDLLSAADHINKLEKAIEAVVEELDGEHRPYDPRTNTAVSPGLHRTNAKLGCVICWPTDGSWPCSTAMIADELRDLVAPETGE